MRLLPAAFLLLLSCGNPDQATERALAAAGERSADDGRVECAVEGADTLERTCMMERVKGPEGVSLTLRHPNGGFRRLLLTGDGRGVIAADGADPAIVSIVSPGLVEVSIAGDRYRLPATIKGGGR